MFPCSVCGKPAKHYVQDMEVAEENGAIVTAPYGEPVHFCDEHTRSPNVHNMTEHAVTMNFSGDLHINAFPQPTRPPQAERMEAMRKRKDKPHLQQIDKYPDLWWACYQGLRVVGTTPKSAYDSLRNVLRATPR